MRQPSVFLAGYYGMHNSGDDILQHVCLNFIENHLQASKILVTAPNDHESTSCVQHHQILARKQRYKGENRLRNYWNAVNADRVIFGGGSVLHTSSDIDQKTHIMKLSGKGQHAAFGIGIGPFKTSEAERSCIKFLNTCRFVGLRDQRSLDIAETIAPRANCHKTFDLAPLFTERQAINHSLNSQKSVKRVGVSLCPLEKFYGGDVNLEDKRLQDIARVLQRLAQMHEIEVFLIDFNGHPIYGDSHLHDALKSQIIREQDHNQTANFSITVQHISYTPYPEKLYSLLASLDVILAMRLHAAILGYLANVPSISLNYHTKCDNWCSDIALPEAMRFDCKEELDTDRLYNMLDQGITQGFPTPQLPIDTAIAQAKENWRLYDECA